MHCFTRLSILLAGLAGFVPPAVAHDFWIEPSTFRPARGEEMTLRLRIGDDFAGETYARDGDLLDAFVLAGPAGSQQVGGRNGDEPAGRVKPDADGLCIAGYRSRPMYLEIEGAKFEEYLWKEGLEQVVKTRHARGQNAKPGRELFSRCAKALVVAGTGSTGGFDRSLGFRLEIIPEKNPLPLAAGGSLPLRVLFDGRPCPDLLLTAISTNAPTRRIQARTDAEGRASLVLPDRSTWLLKTVHIFPAADTKKADWESLWATFIFSQP